MDSKLSSFIFHKLNNSQRDILIEMNVLVLLYLIRNTLPKPIHPNEVPSSAVMINV
jgi:hypothetical protein